MSVISCEHCSELILINRGEEDAAKAAHLEEHTTDGHPAGTNVRLPVYASVEEAYFAGESGRVMVYENGIIRLPHAIPNP